VNVSATSVAISGEYSESRVLEAATSLQRSLQEPACLAFAFVSPSYLAHLDAFCETLRVDGHISTVVGCTTNGVIIDKEEKENSEGVSILAFSAPVSAFDLTPIAQDQLGGDIPKASRVVLLNPFEIPAEDWIADNQGTGPSTVGGLASGGLNADACAVFINDEVVPGVEVRVNPPLTLNTLVSQGCRPIGEPITVTKADDNVVYSLGLVPAYEALESAFESLTETEKKTAKGNLFAGLAGNEYVDNFEPGDFLVRSILAADPSSGAVAIGGTPRVGQTLQYQLRDSDTAHTDLVTETSQAATQRNRPLASILFSCLSRGRTFFGEPNHDASLVQTSLGEHPSAGAFCNGEIGPIAEQPCLHTHTVSCALFSKTRPE